MSSSSNVPHPARLVAVGAAATTGVAMATWALTGVLASTMSTILAPGPTTVDELVTGMSAAGSLALLLWVTLGLLVSAVSTLPGPLGQRAGQVRDRIAPGVVRRWASLLLGIAIASTVVPGGAAASGLTEVINVTEVTLSRPVDQAPEAPLPAVAPAPTMPAVAPAPTWADAAWADPTVPTTAPAPIHATAPPPAPDPAPAPEWTPSPVRPQPPVTLTTPRTSPPEQTPRDVIVRRGDTLWDLAAAYLPPEATDAQIATEWQRWHAANRSVIGADPDLILPGQVLHIPPRADAATPAGDPR